MRISLTEIEAYTNKHFLSSKGFGQCVENAECSGELGGECVCKKGFFPSNGQCTNLKREGERCSGNGQCVPNAQCAPPENGTCTCNSNFYAESGSCEPKVKIIR